MATPIPRPDPTTQPPNFGVGDTYSWVKVKGLEEFRDMYARATYCTNLGDLTVTMSATDVRIGGVEIVDNDTGIRCDVTTFNYEDGSYNALRVVTQDLEPTYDGVSIGDTNGNMVGVNTTTSSLLVDVTNISALTALTQNEFDQTQTLLGTVNTSVNNLNTTTRTSLQTLTALTQNEFNETQTFLNNLTSLTHTGVTLLNALTAKEYTINLDTSAINVNTDEIESLIKQSNTLLSDISSIGLTHTTQLNILTSNSTYGTSVISPEYTSIVNFDSLSSVVQSDTIISLLNALTAREYDININAGDINLNTDEIEGQLYQTANLLNTLTANSVYGTSDAIPLHITGNVETTIINQITGTGVSVSFADSSNLDAFGRLRVSEPKTLLDAKHLRDKLPLIFNELLSGTATAEFSANDSMVVMSTVAKNDIAIRQTRHHFNYQPGKSIQAFFTGKLQPEAGIIKRVGLFQGSSITPYEPSDGIFLEVNDKGPSFNIVKTNGTSYSTTIPQSAWNIDKLDGAGVSKANISLSSAQIFSIDYEWLGLGRVRFGFIQAGKYLPAHYENHVNQLDRPYITSPNQPVRYEIRQLNDTPGSLHQICSTVMIEGGEDDVGKPIALTNNKITGINTDYHVLLAVRLKSTALNSSVILKSVQVLNTGSSNPGMFDVILNPTSFSSPLTWTDVPNTSVQQTTNLSVTTLTGGYSLFKGFAPASIGGSSTTESLAIPGEIARLGVGIDDTTDIIVLAGKAFANNQTVDLIGIMNLLERS